MLTATLVTGLLLTNSVGALASRDARQTTRLQRVAHKVFGKRAGAALCIAHYESTDGAHLYNWPNLGPWQISVTAHPWVDRRRVVTDWLYSARVAYRISKGGTDWGAWATAGDCGL